MIVRSAVNFAICLSSLDNYTSGKRSGHRGGNWIRFSQKASKEYQMTMILKKWICNVFEKKSNVIPRVNVTCCRSHGTSYHNSHTMRCKFCLSCCLLVIFTKTMLVKRIWTNRWVRPLALHSSFPYDNNRRFGVGSTIWCQWCEKSAKDLICLWYWPPGWIKPLVQNYPCDKRIFKPKNRLSCSPVQWQLVLKCILIFRAIFI